MVWNAISHDCFAQLLAEVQTTNPSSLTLALVGIVTYFCYQVFARPGQDRSKVLRRGQSDAKPPASVAESPTEERRVA
jgi:hypothetical protein